MTDRGDRIERRMVGSRETVGCRPACRRRAAAIAFVLCGLFPLARSDGRPGFAAASQPELILVVGAGGLPEYADAFQSWAAQWEGFAERRGIETTRIGPMIGGAGEDSGDRPEAKDAPDDRERLRKRIESATAGDDARPLWIVLIGHGTYDRDVANFNLVGPDVSASELADWLRPLSRPLLVINTASASGPFINRLSAPGRIVITATQSGAESNFARFGEYLAATLSNRDADLDHDGELSVLEAFLHAADGVRQFYRSENRLLTENALIDDTGDGLGTPATFFRGLRVEQTVEGEVEVDGRLAKRTILVPAENPLRLTVAEQERRAELESQLEELRQSRSQWEDEEYYRRLEERFLELAAIYSAAQQRQSAPGSGETVAEEGQSVAGSDEPAGPVPAADVADFECRQTDQEITLSWGDRPLLRYNIAERDPPEGIDDLYRRSGYIHPIWTPSGRIVSGDFAADHPHQHGLFLAFVDTTFEGRSVDFWNQRAGTGAVAHEEVVAVRSEGASAGFEVRLSHSAILPDTDPQPVLRETWSVEARRPPAAATEGVAVIDFRSEIRCVAPSPLKVNEYHYGGLGIRGADAFYRDSAAAAWRDWSRAVDAGEEPEPPGSEPMGHRFLTDRGRGRHDGNHSQADWVSLSGSVDEAPAGIAIIGHPSNFRAPQRVRLHPSKPYFCFAPMVDGEFELAPGETFVSRYRLVVHDGPADASLLDTLRDEFAAER